MESSWRGVCFGIGHCRCFVVFVYGDITSNKNMVGDDACMNIEDVLKRLNQVVNKTKPFGNEYYNPIRVIPFDDIYETNETVDLITCNHEKFFTVQDAINALNKIEDKTKMVRAQCTSFREFCMMPIDGVDNYEDYVEIFHY